MIIDLMGCYWASPFLRFSKIAALTLFAEHAYVTFCTTPLPDCLILNLAANYDAGVFESCQGDDT
jgi:hypothetical protein